MTSNRANRLAKNGDRVIINFSATGALEKSVPKRFFKLPTGCTPAYEVIGAAYAGSAQAQIRISVDGYAYLYSDSAISTMISGGIVYTL